MRHALVVVPATGMVEPKLVVEKASPIYPVSRWTRHFWMAIGMKEDGHIIALDMGTTSTKGLLYAIGRGILSTRSREYRTYYPSQGRAEQDPDEVLNAVVQVVHDLVTGSDIDASSVRALVFGGILHSLIPINGEGRALTRALIWADMRAIKQCDLLRKRLDTSEIRSRTGCPLHPLYFMPRLLWIREESPDVFRTAARFISIKEYVLHRLYGEYAVDRSIASGTGLMNTSTLDWDQGLLLEAGVTSQQVSPIVDTGYRFPRMNNDLARRMGLLLETPGIIGASDGPLAHLGSVGMDPSRMSLTIGTSAALRRMVNEPTMIPGSEAWCYYMTEGRWLLGGVVHDAGNVIQWFADRFLEGDGDGVFQLLERVAREIPPGAGGLLFLPFMSGQRSPFYNPSVHTAVIGMTFSHGKEHILRAVVEGIAYRIHSVHAVLDPEGTCALVVTGGILRSESWMQITADFLGKRLFRAGVNLASAWGAVLVALRSLGIVDSVEGLSGLIKSGPPVEFDTGNHRFYNSVLRQYERFYKKLFT